MHTSGYSSSRKSEELWPMQPSCLFQLAAGHEWLFMPDGPVHGGMRTVVAVHACTHHHIACSMACDDHLGCFFCCTHSKGVSGGAPSTASLWGTSCCTEPLRQCKIICSGRCTWPAYMEQLYISLHSASMCELRQGQQGLVQPCMVRSLIAFHQSKAYASVLMAW